MRSSKWGTQKAAERVGRLAADLGLARASAQQAASEQRKLAEAPPCRTSERHRAREGVPTDSNNSGQAGGEADGTAEGGCALRNEMNQGDHTGHTDRKQPSGDGRMPPSDAGGRGLISAPLPRQIQPDRAPPRD